MFLSRILAIKVPKFGMAITVMIVTMAMTTISSRSVKPAAKGFRRLPCMMGGFLFKTVQDRGMEKRFSVLNQE